MPQLHAPGGLETKEGTQNIDLHIQRPVLSQSVLSHKYLYVSFQDFRTPPGSGVLRVRAGLDHRAGQSSKATVQPDLGREGGFLLLKSSLDTDVGTHAERVAKRARELH